jgi:hypothetical protein
VGSERFEAPECLFQPNLIDVEAPGMAGKKESKYHSHKRAHYFCEI